MSTRLNIENYDELYLVATMHPDKVVRARTGIEIVNAVLRNKEIDNAQLNESLDALTRDKNLAGVARIRAGKARVDLLASQKKIDGICMISIAKSSIPATVRTYAEKALERLGGLVHIGIEREIALDETKPLNEREKAGERLVGELDKRGDAEELVKIFTDEKYLPKTRMHAWEALKKNFREVLESDFVPWVTRGFEGFSIDELKKISSELIELLVENGCCYTLEHMALQTRHLYENLPGWIASKAENRVSAALEKLLEIVGENKDYKGLVWVRESELLKPEEKDKAEQLLISIVVYWAGEFIRVGRFSEAIRLLHDKDVPGEAKKEIKRKLDLAVTMVSGRLAELGLVDLKEEHHKAIGKRGPLGKPPEKIIRRRPMRIRPIGTSRI